MKQGQILPGKKIVPEKIRENRDPYYKALKDADRNWEKGRLDVSMMIGYLADLLKGQLSEK